MRLREDVEFMKLQIAVKGDEQRKLQNFEIARIYLGIEQALTWVLDKKETLPPTEFVRKMIE